MDFRDYLISRGGRVYNRTMNDPETLLDDQLVNGEWQYSQEYFQGIADEVAKEKNWTGVGNWFPTRRANPGKMIDTGNEAEIKQAFPRVYKHWKQVMLEYELRRKARKIAEAKKMAEAKETAEAKEANEKDVPNGQSN